MTSNLRVWVYRGKLRGKRTSGLMLAPNKILAEKWIKHHNIETPKISAEPVATFLWQHGDGFDRDALAQIFELISENLHAGVEPIKAFSNSASFVSRDRLLKTACRQITVFMENGKSLPEAMENAGFAAADFQCVKAMRQGANYGDVFAARAETLKFEANGENLIKQAIWPLLAAAVFIVCVTSVIFLSVGPTVADTISDLLPPQKINGILGWYVGTMHTIKNSPVIFATIYWSLVSGFIIACAHSVSRNRIIQTIMPAYRKFKYDLDQYRVWQLWHTLSPAGKTTHDIFGLATLIVKDRKIVEQTQNIAKQSSQGHPLLELIERYVTDDERRDQLTAVFRGGDKEAGVKQILSIMRIEITERARRCAQHLSIATKIIIGVFFCLILMMIMLPNFLIVANIN